ncbi:DegT/DnrJ/EryC1/StrS aminotransferase [Desulfobacca acetoxidans DSM 11109]|uniref:DegT/DnrJ/EryC1/StrS aminotransferase n=2 Tax=Desulfobacca acetoxidans TaxID=60893 RepID=F2NDG2_DESAR|nr:DegT/DnrJ/EryC1/StrS aminotransferase [Desulfobacca acetoxidans DSM 11109]
MIKYSFTCNSLKLKHFAKWLYMLLCFPNHQRFIRLFCEILASYLAIPPERVFLFASGRMGLYTLLKSLALQPDDEVIVPGYTCVVVTNAIKYAGLKIRYIDIQSETLNLDTKLLLESITPKTKVIVVSHNFGIVYEDIPLIKQKFPHIIVVEDAAHALGSRFKNGRKTGTEGDAAFFSFEYSKPITTGLGGALIVNNAQLHPAIEELYNRFGFPPRFATVKVLITLFVQLLTSYRYTVCLRGLMIQGIKLLALLATTSKAEIQGAMPHHYPSRLAPHLALLGFLQMQEIEAISCRKAAIAGVYHKMCQEISGVYDIYNAEYVYVRYPVIFSETADQSRIDEIGFLVKIKTGIALGEWFNDVVHPKGSYRYDYKDYSCKIGEIMAQRIINFPINIHTTIDTQTTRKLISIFNDFLLTG